MSPRASDNLTHVELIWIEKRIEHWLRFGRDVGEKILDRRRRVFSFAPNSIFAFVRWAGNDVGTVVSRIDILRAVGQDEGYSTVPYVRPGAEILLRTTGWPRVARVLRSIDAVEAAGVDPADACPDHWRHVHKPSNRWRGTPRLFGGTPRGVAVATEVRAMTRAGVLLAGCAGVIAVVVPAWLHPAPKLIWNASASVPIGLYAVRSAGVPRIGNLVVVMPPGPLGGFLARRGYLPEGVPLLKQIAALRGQVVCRVGRAVTVDGTAAGNALARDSRGRSLPVWQGCRKLRDDDVFLMNRQSADSFDGRYFGPLPANTIVGRATPLWTKKER